MGWYGEYPERMIFDELFDPHRDMGKPLLGEAMVSAAGIDQRRTVNPVALAGQSDIIYNVVVYRIAKWHWNILKADEYIMIQPTAPPGNVPLMMQKEKLESHIKAGLASAAQAVADYELLKHDERKYREILDFFKMGQKDEHVLRALFVDRVDAHTGEGFSMISMTRRWPTIIGDFIKMKSEWRDTETIMKELKVSLAEAVVLKTKNELFLEWKKLFFPDVKDRYARIKNLLEARKRSVDEYRDWLKPYVEKYRRIKEVTEIKPSANLTNPLALIHSPWGGIFVKLWVWKPIRPEEMGKPLYIDMEIDPYDKFVKKWLKKIEKKYNVKFYDSKEEVEKLKKEGKPIHPYHIIVRDKLDYYMRPGKKGDILTEHPAPLMDKRHIYYMFIDLDYELLLVKSATGPLEMEDQYWHIHPFIISQNVLLLLLLEHEAKKLAFERYVNELIGVKEVEEEIRKEVEAEFEEKPEKKKEKKDYIKSFKEFMEKLQEKLEPIIRYFIKKGPYEKTALERLSKTFGDYMGPQTAEIANLIKETCFKLSGQSL
jgi:hypothetical protein